MTKAKLGLINYLTLCSSVSTLICCALPALLVSLGLGAVLAGLASNIPGLIWVSENKRLVFLFSGLMLSLNGALLYKNRNAPCPIEPELRDACINGRRASKYVYLASVVIYLTGFVFAFVLPSI